MDELFGDPVAANNNTPRDYAAERARRLAASPDRICEHCGTTFKRLQDKKNAARFCSRVCGYAAGANVWRAPVISEDLMIAAKSLCVSFKVYRCVCRQCAVRFSSRSISSAYCSDRCLRDRYVAANDNRDHSPRECKDCGAVFTTSYGDTRKVYCSAACGKRNLKRKQRKMERARLRSVTVESVDPIAVFERDKWKCQLCMVSTPRNLRGTTNDRAPELDHIMPLSLGGAHSYMNTQCACRKCNIAKSNTPPDQVGLFAYVS